MQQSQTKDLFQLQAEFMDTKIEVAVGKSIDRVVEQIVQLQKTVTQLREEMHGEISQLREEIRGEISQLREEVRRDINKIDCRLVAVETKLGMVNETQKEIRAKFIDYGFKAGWLLMGALLSYGIIYLQGIR